MEPTRAELDQRVQFLSDEAEAMEAEAGARQDALQDYIHDEEREIDALNIDAETMWDEIRHIESEL